ncbi:MAG: DUF3267 domain-containing protein [Solobacterium sp.]|nr:DUF3267 domain-containing protein [Solobacterium sp.]
MKAYQTLPEGYREILQINLQKDKKTALKINLIAVVVMILLFVLGHFIVPITEFQNNESLSTYFIQVGVILLGYVIYIILHELTHGAVMKAVGGGKVVFGFTGLYAFAGSKEDYFDKISYRYISLAPLVVWGIILGVLCVIVPRTWFWVVWFLQVGNISGAAGDVYVTAKLWNYPGTILVRDTGVDMTIYDRTESADSK